MTNKHTPAPWTEGAITNTSYWDDGKLREIKDCKGTPFAQIQLADESKLEDFNLMLAAPELLEALEELYEYYDGARACNFEDLEKKIKSAIKKARGE